MNLKLKGIGIIKDSDIKIDGLTVITGKNNSGKTTVGKALYSLLDSVCDISKKANKDKISYIQKTLRNVKSQIEIIGALGINNTDESKSFLKEYHCIELLFKDKNINFDTVEEYETFVTKLLQEFHSFDSNAIDAVLNQRFGLSDLLKGDKELERIKIVIQFNIERSIQVLTQMLEDLHRDTDLSSYTKENILQTLRIEFSDQIQPIGNPQLISEIELKDGDKENFKFRLFNNSIIDDEDPIFYTSKYTKVLFVDDPFILDDTPHRKYSTINNDTKSFIDAARLLSHDNKLKKILRQKSKKSVLEHMFKNESLKKVEEKINLILPGSFDFSDDGEFYVNNGMKLKISNLATGSKLFSIIKILLEKGEINDTTMLILDEPEAHLHPQWQNAFAEFIVLLVKELNVSVVLTSHSPNFVLALDAYIRKYDITNRTNFYQTKVYDDGFVDYECVNDNIEFIYDDFLQYFSEVKSLRDEYVHIQDDSGDL